MDIESGDAKSFVSRLGIDVSLRRCFRVPLPERSRFPESITDAAFNAGL